jgi:transposase-like protein
MSPGDPVEPEAADDVAAAEPEPDPVAPRAPQRPPIEQEPWWSEARQRLDAGEAIRAVARRFGCEPRRVRRALARAGVRVAGAPVPAEGVAALAPLAEQLGMRPDRELAREAHVIPEAVAGERARRDIPAFRYKRPVKVELTVDDQAWIRGPKKFKRERRRFDTDDLQVVRRPARGTTDDIPSGPGAARSTSAPAKREWAPSFSAADDPARAVPRRSFFADEREQKQRELEMLTQPSLRNRDARQRIVRADVPARPAEPVVEGRRGRGPGRPVGSGWRESQLSAEEIEAAAAAAVARSTPPAGSIGALDPSAAPAFPRPPAPAARAATAAPAVGSKAADRPSLPRGLPPAKPAAPALQRWALHVDGLDTGWSVVAADIAAAATLFASEVPELMEGNASIVALGPA